MKFTDLSLVFLLFAVTVFTGLDVRIRLIDQTMRITERYDQIIDTAAVDALRNTVEEDNYGRKVFVNKDATMERFLEELYLSFDIYENNVSQEVFREYLPVVLLVEMDGFYVNTYRDADNPVGSKCRERSFGEKQYFRTEEGAWEIYFSFADYISLVNKSSGRILEGTPDAVSKQLPLNFLQDRKRYEERKKRTVIEAIREQLEQEVNANPKLDKTDIQYRFSFPYIDYEEWYQSVRDVSLLAFFQGLPMGVGDKTYNRFVFSGSRLEKY